MYNTQDGDLMYEMITDDAADWVLQLIDESNDIDSVMDRINALILKAKYKCYNIRSFSRKQYEDFCMEDVWKHRLRELDMIHKELELETEPNKIHKSRSLVERKSQNYVVTSLRDP